MGALKEDISTEKYNSQNIKTCEFWSEAYCDAH